MLDQSGYEKVWSERWSRPDVWMTGVQLPFLSWPMINSDVSKK
jgi:hypothetical protein